MSTQCHPGLREYLYVHIDWQMGYPELSRFSLGVHPSRPVLSAESYTYVPDRQGNVAMGDAADHAAGLAEGGEGEQFKGDNPPGV